MDPSGPLEESLSALTQFFVGDGRLDETVHRVVELAGDAVQSAMTGITMLVGGHPTTAFFTDAEAPEIDQAQYTEGTGPCLDAFCTGTTIRVDSLESETRWPVFRERAMSHGIFSTLSLPLVADGRESVGALNLYGRIEHAFNGADEATARLFAQHAAVVLANARAYWDSRDLGMRMQEAQQFRVLIEQAKGMLMAASDINAERAFDLMVLASQRENRKLRDIAAEIVARRGRPPVG